MTPPCSEEELDALERAAVRLQDERYAVDVDEYAARPSQAPALAAYVILAAVAALLVYPAPLAAAALGGAAIVLHARDSEGRPLLRQTSCTSRCVIARAPGATTPELVVVVQAVVPALRFSEARTRALGVVAQLGMLVVAAAGASAWVAQAGAELPRSVGAAGLIASALLAGVAALLYGPRRGASASQDAAVEALFQLAPRLRDHQVWLVVAGGTPVDGVDALLAARGETSGASWLNLLRGASPGVRAASEEGTWRELRADRAMMGAAEEAGAEVGPYRAAPTAATALLARRRRALTLVIGPAPDDLEIVLATARSALGHPAGSGP